MTNFYLKQLLFFRQKYISSLKSYPIRNTPESLDHKLYSKLEGVLKKAVDEQLDSFKKEVSFLNTDKRNFLKEISYHTENGEVEFARAVKTQLKKIDLQLEIINSNTKLYLIKLNERLNTKEVVEAFGKIGFQSASLLETLIFIQQYGDGVENVAIYSPKAYYDSNKIVYEFNSNWYCIGYMKNRKQLYDYGLFPIGDVERNESMGYTFMEEALYLVKPI